VRLNLLSVPRVRTHFGSRSFSVAAPTIWNSIPFDIRNSCSIASFRRKLKTFFFQRLAMSSAPSLLTPAPQIRRVCRRHCTLYKLNLLTYLLKIIELIFEYSFDLLHFPLEEIVIYII